MRKSLSLLLAFAMVFTMFAGVAFAADADATAKEKLVTAKVIIGDKDGNTLDDQNWKRQDVAVLLSRLYDEEDAASSHEKTHTYADVKDSYYDGVLSWAKDHDPQLMKGHSDVKFGYNEEISAQQFATVLLRALGIDDFDNAIERAVEEGIFAEELEADAPVSRGASYDYVVNTLDTVLEDGQTLGASLGLEGWVLEVGEQGVKSVKVTAVNKIEVAFNVAVADKDDVEFAIKRGAAVYGSSVEWNDDNTVATLVSVINLPAADYTVEVSGLGDEVLSFDITVKAQTATAVEVVSTTIALENNATFAFKVTDQYGNDMKINSNDSQLTSVAYNVTQNRTVTLTPDGVGKFKVDATFESAELAKLGDVIRVTLSYKGITGQANLTVIEPSAGDVIQLGSIVLEKDQVRLSAKDTEVELDYVLLDQYGNKLTLSKNENTGYTTSGTLTVDGIQFLTSNPDVIKAFRTDKDGKLFLQVDKAGSAIITAIINKSGAVEQTTVTVEKAEEPTTAVIAHPTTIIADGDGAFDLDVILSDQFGTTIKPVTTGATQTTASVKDINDANVATAKLNDDGTKVNVHLKNLANDAERDITVEIKHGTKVIGSVTFKVQEKAVATQIKSVKFATLFEQQAALSIARGDVEVIDQFGREFKAGTLTITSADTDKLDTVGNAVYADDLGATKLTVAVLGVTLDVDVEVIASEDVKSYSIDDLGTIYNSKAIGDYSKAIALKGVNGNGKAVNLKSSKPDAVTSSSSAVASIVDEVNVVGQKAGEATISAWLNGKNVASSKVTVSEEAPYAAKVEWTAATVAAGTNAKTIVKVTDQYGVNITAGTTVYFSGGGTIITSTGATTAGKVTVTVIAPNGESAVREITVN